MADIGEPRRRIYVEPMPEPEQAPVKEPAPDPSRQPEPV